MASAPKFHGRKTRNTLINIEDNALDTQALILRLSRERNPMRRKELMLEIIDRQKQIQRLAATLEKQRFKTWKKETGNK